MMTFCCCDRLPERLWRWTCSALKLATLNRLQHLDLSGTEVEPAALQALGALSSLQSVVIPVESITDEESPRVLRGAAGLWCTTPSA